MSTVLQFYTSMHAGVAPNGISSATVAHGAEHLIHAPRGGGLTFGPEHWHHVVLWIELFEHGIVGVIAVKHDDNSYTAVMVAMRT